MGLHLGMDVPNWPPENIEELAKKFEDQYLSRRHQARRETRPPSERLRRDAMRHGNAHRKLNRTASHRTAMFANMAAALIKHEQIVTTLPKAKELRPFVEKLVTLAKRGDLHARRLAIAADARRRPGQASCSTSSARATRTATAATPACSRPASATATTPPMAVIEFVDRDEAAKGLDSGPVQARKVGRRQRPCRRNRHAKLGNGKGGFGRLFAVRQAPPGKPVS